MSDDINIRYRLTAPDGESKEFDVYLDGGTLDLRKPISVPTPDWARLDCHQCPNCPLDAATSPHCPLAVSLTELVRYCTDIVSYKEVRLEVELPERSISKETTAQRAIAALMGLIIATSGCPHTVLFKPMARFHLPLSSEEETIYRATSMYLLTQYMAAQSGQRPDWEMLELTRVYREMQTVNRHIARRLQEATNKDSSVNALILLDLFSKALPDTIDERLAEIRYLFASYLDSAEAGARGRGSAPAQNGKTINV